MQNLTEQQSLQLAMQVIYESFIHGLKEEVKCLGGFAQAIYVENGDLIVEYDDGLEGGINTLRKATDTESTLYGAYLHLKKLQ
jgi:hypothetical protein